MNDKLASIMKYAPIVISLASLAISLVTLWYTKFSPFNLNVFQTGRIEMTANPLRADKQLALNLQLLLHNDGARQGYVRNIAIIMAKEGKQSDLIILRSVFEITDDSLNLGKELTPPKMLPFNSFPIGPGETIIKKFAFLPEDPVTEYKFELGRYLISIYTLEADQGKDWHIWETVTLDVDLEDLNQLSKVKATLSPDGRTYVNLISQSKATVEQEVQIQKLKTMLKK